MFDRLSNKESCMLHLYWGDGKGKTTAAMGLA
ncbi:cob(I)yrinic acid a,c-diamide adenosyltransferase, partial [Gemmiger formicilis]|nr:cob(I)yrinic acid a,c-diamide adenosyltransferase [Gemmiger formicilis]